MNEIIKLREDNPDVFLTVYRPGNVGDGLPVIICPGGGYHMVAQSEGEPMALRFAEAGYHAYVLSYSVGAAAGLEDAARPGAPPSELEPVKDIGLAFEAVRQSSDAHEIILCGFSAGAHAAATYCYGTLCRDSRLRGNDKQDTSGTIPEQRTTPAQSVIPAKAGISATFTLPCALILGYPPTEISWLNVGSETYNVVNLITNADADALSIPVFVWNAANDQMVDPQDSVKIDEALKSKGADCTYLRDEDGIHGQPLYNDSWVSKMLKWLNEAKQSHPCL